MHKPMDVSKEIAKLLLARARRESWGEEAMPVDVSPDTFPPIEPEEEPSEEP